MEDAGTFHEAVYDALGWPIQIWVGKGDFATWLPSRSQGSQNMYDTADRLTATVDFGTNGGSAPALAANGEPALPARVAADGNDTFLRTDYQYDAAGNQDNTFDPRDIETADSFDALGRLTTQIVGYGQSPTSTTYLYDGMNHQILVTVTSPASGDTTVTTSTRSIYGGSFSGATNGAGSNDYLTNVIYTDPSNPPPTFTTDEGVVMPYTASNTVYYQFDTLGETTYEVDRSGARHTFGYDASGNMISDTVNYGALNVGNNKGFSSLMDESVGAHTYVYDSFGRIIRATSWSGAANTSSVQNDVVLEYDGLNNLTDEYEADSGAVVLTTPDVHYTYTDDFSNNFSRLTAMTYPNGRVLDYGYVGLDNTISRVTYLADAGGSNDSLNLEQYQYLGLSTIVDQSRPAAGVDLSYMSGTGSSTTFPGLDTFGRVINQDWISTGTSATTSGTVLDDHQYVYDADGNILSSVDELYNYRSDLYQANGATASTAYNSQNQMTNFARGTLTSSAGVARPNQVSAPAGISESFSSNSSGDLQRNGAAANGQTPQSRPIDQGSFSAAQEASNLGTPFSPGGNSALSDQYDAWGNLTSSQSWNVTWTKTHIPRAYVFVPTATQTGGSVYRYNALGQRIGVYTTTYNASGTQTGSTLINYYTNSSGQTIEEQSSINGGAFSTTAQYVWGMAGSTDLVLRDSGNGTGGNLGKASSGLNQRLFPLQDIQGSTTALLGSLGNVVERDYYTPDGSVYVTDANSNQRGTGNGVQNSLYNWQYTFEGGHDDGNGLFYLNGVEMDPVTGGPLQEDPHAYAAFNVLYSQLTAENSSVDLGKNWGRFEAISSAVGVIALSIAIPPLGSALAISALAYGAADLANNLSESGNWNSALGHTFNDISGYNSYEQGTNGVGANGEALSAEQSGQLQAAGAISMLGWLYAGVFGVGRISGGWTGGLSGGSNPALSLSFALQVSAAGAGPGFAGIANNIFYQRDVAGGGGNSSSSAAQAAAQADIEDFYANEDEEGLGRRDDAIPERFLNPNNRPAYAPGQVQAVWQNALLEGNGKVLDPFTGEILTWDPTFERDGQWDMGHIQSYSAMHAKLLNGEMSWDEFMEWYYDPASYKPQSIPSNRGRLGGS